ncbi:MAG TPA: 4Fe-4S dicluster domain-containing protein, partial [bacterium]|nr:4Fe-4S dicluster domain-containing protein [bacterium]
HPETAGKLGVSQGDTVNIISPNGQITAPAYIYQGIHKNAVALPIGQGHKLYGRYADNRGANPIEILSSEPIALSGSLPFLTQLVKIEKSKIKKNLVSTEGGTFQGKREIIQMVSLSEGFKPSQKKSEHTHPDMYEPIEHPVYHWGMTIDLNKCTGCASCTAACFAENNIAMVGEEEVGRGREMQWIRIEKYIEFENDKFSIDYIPILCQQCDNAPCESVCPVFATNHSREGLNLQIYNRCVGTRYCSNNCPYKVRRFNWFDNDFPEPLNRQLNPDVTVRERGVMEKCTFCVQRIRIAKDKAKDKGKTVQDGEVTPACAQTCPANAIIFGNMNDKNSKVYKLSKDIRAYHLLEELNTKPSITYLKKVKHNINL